MSRIIGNETILKRVSESRAGDPAIYINMEAIAQLPDDYESVIVKVDFDKQQDFTNVGTESNPSWYPKPPLIGRIAEARGITVDGMTDETISVFENVNISVMEMVPTPVIQNKKVGYSVKKTGSVMMEDGTVRSYSEWSTENAWEEAELLWTKEEMYTEGYSKAPKYPPKYENKWKRRMHFQELLDKAEGKARTNAFVKVVRTLACIKTGYKTDELKEGCFYFAKIRRSEMVRKAETAARLNALSQGITPPALQDATKQLFGKIVEPNEISAPVDITPDPDPFSAPEPAPAPVEKTKREIALDTLKKYIADNVIPEKHVITASRLLDWFSKPENDDTTELWNTAMTRIKTIEADIPEALRIKHGL